MFSKIVLYFLFTLIISANAACPTGSIQGLTSDVCYSFSQYLDTWPRGESYCSHQGGHLASITSALENSFLLNATQYNYIWGYEGYFWIGMIKQNDVWTWTDGTPTSYTNWNAGQPIDTSDRNCTGLYVLNGGTWYSLDGINDHAPFICQFNSSKF